jgi:hypothetical protein
MAEAGAGLVLISLINRCVMCKTPMVQPGLHVQDPDSSTRRRFGILHTPWGMYRVFHLRVSLPRPRHPRPSVIQRILHTPPGEEVLVSCTCHRGVEGTERQRFSVSSSFATNCQ